MSDILVDHIKLLPLPEDTEKTNRSWLAWAYVGLRVLHTITQVTVNNVTLRVACFATSSAFLVAMIVREALKFV